MRYSSWFVTRRLYPWSVLVTFLLVLTCNQVVRHATATQDPTPNNNTSEDPSSSPTSSSSLSSSSSSSSPTTNLCGIYLAESTIPGAGLGMFAGQYDYQEGDVLGGSDLIIPAYDMTWNNYFSDSYNFLWDDYTWKAKNFIGMSEEIDRIKKVKACSPGFGAAVNCILSLVNARDDWTSLTMGTSGVDSTTSPGAGGFTPFYGRTWRAKNFIPAGMELYGNYGQGYFKTRDGYEMVPLYDDYKAANKLLKRFQKVARKVKVHKAVDTYTFGSEKVVSDLLSILQTLSDVWMGSRTMHAIPSKATVSDIAVLLDSGGTGMQHYNASIRSQEWLREHGRCMDNLKDGISTIPHAGRGAFARRFIPKGGLVAPAPLIHIPNRTIFAVYEEKREKYNKLVEGTVDEYKVRTRIVPNLDGPIHWQLLLNYCMGHRDSSVLLCPYGVQTSLINHDGTNPNTRVAWTDDDKLRNPEWRELPIKDWGEEDHAGLSFDFIALRDIEPDEEITIDYGAEWTQAWEEHVKRYEESSVPYRPREYMPAFERNKLVDQRLPTMYEQVYTYSNLGVRLFCRRDFLEWSGILDLVAPNQTSDDDADTSKEGQILDFDEREVFPCRIRSRKGRDDDMDNDNDNHDDMYVAEILADIPSNDGGNGEISNHLLVKAVAFGLTRDAFYFADIPYHRDHHQFWAFRHDIRIPDDIFPEAWKDRRVVHESNAADVVTRTGSQEL